MCLGEGVPGQPCSPSSRSRGLWPCASVLPPVNWGLFPLSALVLRRGIRHPSADGLRAWPPPETID